MLIKNDKNKMVWITQKQIAASMGVSVGFVCHVMKGRRNMPEKYKRKLKRELGIPYSFWGRSAA